MPEADDTSVTRTPRDPNTIWYQTVDDDEYQCKVEGIDGEKYTGILTVTNDGVVLHREEVPLAYGAIFGPDVDDVATWQERCIEVIDNKDKRLV